MLLNYLNVIKRLIKGQNNYLLLDVKNLLLENDKFPPKVPDTVYLFTQCCINPEGKEIRENILHAKTWMD